jgi:hypothetical protein
MDVHQATIPVAPQLALGAKTMRRFKQRNQQR